MNIVAYLAAKAALISQTFCQCCLVIESLSYQQIPCPLQKLPAISEFFQNYKQYVV